MRSLVTGIRLNAKDPLKADAILMDFHLLMLHCCGNRVMEVFANVVRTYFHSTKSLVKDMPKEFFEEKATLLEGFLKALSHNDLPKATDLLRQSIEAKPSALEE